MIIIWRHDSIYQNDCLRVFAMKFRASIVCLYMWKKYVSNILKNIVVLLTSFLETILKTCFFCEISSSWKEIEESLSWQTLCQWLIMRRTVELGIFGRCIFVWRKYWSENILGICRTLHKRVLLHTFCTL